MNREEKGCYGPGLPWQVSGRCAAEASRRGRFSTCLSVVK